MGFIGGGGGRAFHNLPLLRARVQPVCDRRTKLFDRVSGTFQLQQNLGINVASLLHALPFFLHVYSSTHDGLFVYAGQDPRRPQGVPNVHGREPADFEGSVEQRWPLLPAP